MAKRSFKSKYGVAALCLLSIILTSSLRSMGATPLENVSSSYDLIIVGGGIAGLHAATSAIAFGVDPEKILIIEKRTREHGYGELQRVVVLDKESIEDLRLNHVEIPGIGLQNIAVVSNSKAPTFFPYSGTYRSAVDALFGGSDREIAGLSSLSEIVQAELNRFVSKGGHIVFDSFASIEDNESSGPRRLVLHSNNGQLSEKTLDAKLIVVAEGSRSGLAKNLKRINIDSENTSNFLSVDANYLSAVIKPGEIWSVIRNDIVIYAFAGRDSVSMNMMLPQGITADGLQSLAPERFNYYQRVLLQTAKEFGLDTSRSQTVSYSGRLSMLDQVMVGSNVVFIGDAAAPADPISGSGANAAMMDGKLIGEYFTDLNKSGSEVARDYLIAGLRKNTFHKIKYALRYREMARHLRSNPRLLDSMGLFGMSNRNAHGVVNTYKGIVTGLADVWSLGALKPMVQVAAKIGGLNLPTDADISRKVGLIFPGGYGKPQDFNVLGSYKVGSNLRSCQSLFKMSQ